MILRIPRYFTAIDEIDSRVVYIAQKLQSIIFDPLINQEIIDLAFINSITSEAANLKTEATNLLEEMSQAFWTENIENEINLSLGFSAFLLKLIESLEDFTKLKLVGESFRDKDGFHLEKILINVNKSRELLSFNISALILFSKLEFSNSFYLEILFWSVRHRVTLSRLTEREYHKLFIKIIIETEFIFEFFKKSFTEDEFTLIAEKALMRTFLVSKEFLEYGADGFTTYDLKIFIREFSPEEDLEKGSIFYVFLHELCHFSRRSKSTSKQESLRAKTPEQTAKNSDALVDDYGYVFEYEIFGSPQRSLNIEACRYLFQVNKCSLEEFRKEFCEKNSRTDLISVQLCRKPLSYKAEVVELLGCGFKGRR